MTGSALLCQRTLCERSQLHFPPQKHSAADYEGGAHANPTVTSFCIPSRCACPSRHSQSTGAQASASSTTVDLGRRRSRCFAAWRGATCEWRHVKVRNAGGGVAPSRSGLGEGRDAPVQFLTEHLFWNSFVQCLAGCCSLQVFDDEFCPSRSP